MAKGKKRRKFLNVFQIKDGTALRFDGVSGRFALPLELPKGVKVRRIRIDDAPSSDVK